MHTDIAQEIFEVVKTLGEHEQLEVLRKATVLAGKERMSIWDRIHTHAAEIPDEEWSRMPVDGAEQHDHHLYGTPKK